MAMSGRLAGKVIVMAGGATCSSEACLPGYAAEGGTVVVGNINVEGAERVAERIRAGGGAASVVAYEGGDLASFEALIAAAERRHGWIDGLHNIAGNPAAQSVDKIPWRATFRSRRAGTTFNSPLLPVPRVEQS